MGRIAADDALAERGAPAASLLMVIAALVALLVAADEWTTRTLPVDAIAPCAAEEHPHAWRVDVNRATAEELSLLPGVGSETARRIVEWRRDHGAFWSCDQLIRVRGIGPVTLERLRPWVEVVPKPA